MKKLILLFVIIFGATIYASSTVSLTVYNSTTVGDDGNFTGPTSAVEVDLGLVEIGLGLKALGNPIDNDTAIAGASITISNSPSIKENVSFIGGVMFDVLTGKISGVKIDNYTYVGLFVGLKSRIQKSLSIKAMYFPFSISKIAMEGSGTNVLGSVGGRSMIGVSYGF